MLGVSKTVVTAKTIEPSHLPPAEVLEEIKF